MSDALRAILIEIMRSHGFDIDRTFGEYADMVREIRMIEILPAGSVLNEVQKLALLDNLRSIIMITASREQSEPSIRRQAGLRRWLFLADTDPAAARGFAAVLRYLGLDVPEHLRGQDE